MSSSAEPLPGPSPIQDAYFRWLYFQVFDTWNPISIQSFTVVAALMHQVIFVSLVDHDENRIADAAELRNEFQRQSGSMGPIETADLMEPDASVFEVLIALAKKADLQIALSPGLWFRIFIENLRLDAHNDRFCRTRTTFPIERIINRFNQRQYTKKGQGNIFAFRKPPWDVRTIEIWYQMGAYMTEQSMY